MKRSLRKSLCDGGGLRWDELLPYVAMGYRMSTQKSLGYSPYFLLFGRDPIFQARHHAMGDLKKEPSDEEMQIFLSTRGQTFRRVMPLAMRNLAIAQQRQKERYSLVRGGEWAKPKASFAVGDYVMVKRETKNTLQAPAHPHVLRIVELRASGVVILEGSDAARCTKQMKDVAHCPLPILDTTLHPGRCWRGASQKCQQCGLPHDWKNMVLCDGCQEAYHVYCMRVPLLAPPKGSWKCHKH